MPATPEYERNRLARVARNNAEGAAPLAHIKKLAGQLVYGGSGDEKQRRKGADAGSGSEYEPNDEEEADDADEVSGEEEEHDPTRLMSKAREKQASTKPPGRKRARPKPAVPTTTRTTRASKSKPTQMEETPSSDNDTSLLQTSKDSNSPQVDTEMQHSQDMINNSCQIDNTVIVRDQGALVCSTLPTNPETSKRGKRRPTMGHGIRDYAKRNGGRKMKIDFSAGRVRPLDPVQAAKLTSQCGIHVRSHMHVAKHWKDYNKEGLDHHIPKAIGHVAKHFEMDPKEELSRSVCTNILQKSIRQQRYRLKKDYFNDRTVEQALANKPPNVSQENWEALVNKWSDQRNKKLCKKNKDNREAVKHQQTTGSRSYPSHFHQIKKDKYNNEDPSPIEFFKETHTRRKAGSMSTAALEAYVRFLSLFSMT
ncbi:unnamed protein product [Alopecurus aequalis]